MLDPDTFALRLEAFAVAARLRRDGEHDIADLVECWAAIADISERLETID